jgi:hypothetical protein
VPGNEKNQEHRINITLVVRHKDAWLFWQVLKSVNPFDKQREKWPENEFGNRICHVNLFFLLLKSNRVYKHNGSEEFKNKL